MSLTPTEVQFLIQQKPQVEQLLAARPMSKKTAVEDAEFFRKQFGSFGRAVMELGQARSSAANKHLPPSWLLCHESAQQATPLPVATVRAERIARCYPSALVHDVTCSIGTEGSAQLAAGLRYLGSDIDFSRVLLARHNLQGSAGWFWLAVADALAPVSQSAVVIADPARRVSGRRITRLEDLLPPLPKLLEAHHEAAMAIKCAPGIDFSSWQGLVSVVSLDGGVKEACLYTPQLAEGRRREAVVIRGQSAMVLHDGMPSDIGAGPVDKYVIDPDGAIVRAGLVRHYGYQEGLWQLDEKVAYLTGHKIPAGASGFPVLELVPVKKLKAALRSYDCGSVEILVRGVAVDPDVLRRKLALKGSVPLAVVLTRIGRSTVALICGAREVTESE